MKCANCQSQVRTGVTNNTGSIFYCPSCLVLKGYPPDDPMPVISCPCCSLCPGDKPKREVELMSLVDWIATIRLTENYTVKPNLENVVMAARATLKRLQKEGF